MSDLLDDGFPSVLPTPNTNQGSLRNDPFIFPDAIAVRRRLSPPQVSRPPEAVESHLETRIVREPAVSPAVIPGNTSVPSELVLTVPTVAEVRERGLHTDADAAVRLAGRLGGSARFAGSLGWLWWDGHRWKSSQDGKGHIHFESMEAARDWTNKAHQLPWAGKGANPAITKAEALESKTHIYAAVELASNLPQCKTDPDLLDQNPWLLNVRNGTLNLKTGALQPHRKEDLITKLADVDYVPGASHPALEQYLATLDENNTGMSDFLSRVFGMSLTGDVSVESIMFLSGPGGSGKTTLAEAVGNMMNDYAAKPDFSTFTDPKFGRTGGAASPDILGLKGVRFVQATEGSSGSRLDAGRVKQLTGNEAVASRALYSNEYIHIKPTWKLFLVSNFDPKADSDDTGLWRRMVKIPFHAIPVSRMDPGIKAALLNDPVARQALLNWCLAGCLDWQARGCGRRGLAIPEAVDTTTQGYRETQDVMGEWWDDVIEGYLELDTKALEDNAVESSEYLLSVTELYAQYVGWCRQNAVPFRARPKFIGYMKGKGLIYGVHKFGYPVKKATRAFRGVRRQAEHLDAQGS